MEAQGSGISNKDSMVKVRKKHASNNSEKVDQNRSKKKRKSKMTVERRYFRRLPREILIKIALKLPVTSIIQLRRSSKFWYELLIDHEFVDLHLTQSLQKSPDYLFIPSYKIDRVNPEIYTVEPTQGRRTRLSTSKMFTYLRNPREIFEFGRWGWIKSSGGLMCVYSKKSNIFRVFNPHIAEEVRVPGIIPNDDPNSKFKNNRVVMKWFFSYSPSTKEYKILMIEFIYYKCSYSTVAAIISTLGTDIWTRIQNVPRFTSIYSFVESQGTLFLLTDNSDFVSFDIVSEKFHVIPAPQHNLPRDVIYEWSLMSMGDTVGYIHKDTLWVLRDKTKGIWIQIEDFKIPPSCFIHVTGVLENDGLFGFMNGSTKVFWCDVGGDVFRVTEINNGDECQCEETDWTSVRYVGTHVRSLVSPVRIMGNGTISSTVCTIQNEEDD